MVNNGKNIGKTLEIFNVASLKNILLFSSTFNDIYIQHRGHVHVHKYTNKYK